MFIRKNIVGFFILQNIVSSFCVTVYPESDSSDSTPEPKHLKSIHNFDQYSKVNFYKKVARYNEYSESNSNENWESCSNESSNESSENYPNESSNESSVNYPNESSNESSENYPNESSNEYSANYSNRRSENNINKKSENNINENTENNVDGTSENNVYKNSENNFNEYSVFNLKDFCHEEDHSIISHSDIKYLIEEKAEILKIKEKISNSVYPDAEEVFKKYMGELEEFQKRFQERPTHMLHVLHDMNSLRQKLEPNVDVIANQLEQLYTLEENYNVVNKSSDFLLTQLEKLKNICSIHCEEIGVETRFGVNSLNISKSTGMYCIRLKDLNDYINKKLSELQSEYDEGLNGTLAISDKMYEQKITKFKSNLKDAAVKEFGMTMYEILSLQDDYNHFIKDLEHANITSETYSIMENTAEISYKQIGLKRDLEKYRQHCMKCVNQRVKRNVFDYLKGVEESTDTPMAKFKNSGTDSSFSVDAAIIELIKAKIDEIKGDIERNYTTMFAELDTKFNDPNVIDSYVKGLHPIQIEIDNDIKAEQEALNRLRSRIPEALIDEILVLSKKSKELIQIMDSTKLFIDQFIK